LNPYDQNQSSRKLQRKRQTRQQRAVDAHDGNGDMGSPKLKVLVIVVIVGLVNLGYWSRLDHLSKEIDSKMKVAEQRNRELADVKARFMERQNQANLYQRRVDVIKQLHDGQTGPVNLMAMMAKPSTAPRPCG